MEPVFPFPLDLSLVAPNKTRALHQQLRAAIMDGRLPPGYALPSIRTAATALGFGRNTIAAAYDLLLAEGYLLPRSRARAVVSDLGQASTRPSRNVATAGVGLLHPQWRKPFARFQPGGDPPAPSFRVGVAEASHFPHALWRRISQQAMRRFAHEPFRYPPSDGLPELRAAIARHVAFARAVRCEANDVVVTSGAQQAFDLIARALLVPGQSSVAVEEPGYPPMRAALLAAGARLVPIPVDDQGLCVEAVPDCVRLICVTPSHQSPTGVVLSRARRQALLDLARRIDAVVLEDDYDGEFRFGGRPLDALKTLDRDSRVFYVGTFSKSLFPALRKGFVVAPQWARAALATIKHCADAHCDELAQRVLATFIDAGHLARHVRRMHAVYGPRRAALLAALRTHLAPWMEIVPSEAGLHLSARIRHRVDAAPIVTAARRCLPGVASSTDYAVNAAAVAPALVLGYGVIDAERIEPLILGLRRELERLVPGGL